MKFEIVGRVTDVEVIASGSGVRVRRLLRRAYGSGRWRKLKAIATVRLPNGALRRVKSTGTKRTDRAKGCEDQRVPGGAMRHPSKPFALCIDNTDYQASLILGKVYQILPDAKAARDDLVRIVDESGEDYLYDKSHFVFVDFPKAVARKILALQPIIA